MQAGSRRGSRTNLTGINRLIALLVLKVLGDVGWQGHLAYLIEDGIELALTVKADHTVAVLLDLHYLTGHDAVAEYKTCAHLCPLAWLCNGLPQLIAHSIEQQKLIDRFAALPDTEDTGGEYAGIVHYQAVSRPYYVKYFVEFSMGDLTADPVKLHEARMVALLSRMLGYQLLRKVIIKIASLHGRYLLDFNAVNCTV